MAIAKAIIDAYQPRNADDMQEALKEIFGPMFEAMFQDEMDSYLGYESNDHGPKSTDNRRNGYINKTCKIYPLEIFQLRFLATEMHRSNLRQFRSVKRMSVVLKIRSYLCMQKE